MTVNKNGFILVLVLVMLAGSIAVVSLVVNRVMGYKNFSRTLDEREQARLLALSGLEIAKSELAIFAPPPKKKKEKKPLKPEEVQKEKAKEAEKEKNDAREKAQIIFSRLNTWQTVTLNEASDGIDGSIEFYISSEEGKINLNSLYDSKKKKFVEVKVSQTRQPPQDKPQGEAPPEFSIPKLLGIFADRMRPLAERQGFKAPQLVKGLDAVYKKYSVPFDDVSQLIAESQFASMADRLFVSPDGSKQLFLNDLFTVNSPSAYINPLLLSQSVRLLFGFADTKKGMEKIQVDELAGLFKLQKIEWSSVWPTFVEPLTGKDYASLPAELKPLFTPKFEANVFSVVSYGRVGESVQKVAAIIEIASDIEKNAGPFIIRKLYWL